MIKKVVGVTLDQTVYDALRRRAADLKVRRSMSQLAAMYIENGLREDSNGTRKEPKNGGTGAQK